MRSAAMARILTIDDAVRERALAKMKQYDKEIKAEVLKAARKKSGLVRGVKSISFSRLDLPSKDILDVDFGALKIDDKQMDVVVYGEEYDNGSDTTDSTEFSYDRDLTHSWHWELTAGVTFTYKTEARLPELATVSKTLEISFSASYGQAGSETNHYAWKSTIGLQPRHKTLVSAMLKQVAGTAPFSCKLIADGVVKCKAELDIKTWPDQSRGFDIPLQRLLSTAERTYRTTGMLIGASGMKTHVSKRVVPLSPEELQNAQGRIVKQVLGDMLLEGDLLLHIH
jgi:hypothetical protein